MKVELHSKPHRHYTIDGETHIDGVKIASVTQVLGVIDKSGPLQHYAAQQTLEGVCKLGRVPRDPKALSTALRNKGLLYWQRTNEAAKRGTTIHKALEDWAQGGVPPNPAEVPEEWRGWITGLAGWLIAREPEFLESEKAVGSKRLAVAGTRDTVLRIKGEEGTILADLKTSKRAYESHFIQLAGYELLGSEMGEPTPNGRMVVVVRADGTWEEYRSPKGIGQEHFEACVRFYRALEEVRKCL